jgi:hypothetical protein
MLYFLKGAALGVLLITALLGTGVLLSSGPPAGADNDEHPETSYRVIEGCEYVFVSRRPFGSNMAMAHKGDCRKCEKRRRNRENQAD